MGVFISVVAHDMSTTTTKTASIIVTPNAGRRGLYDARLDGGCVLVTASRQPFVDAARRLTGLGHDPMTVLVMRHAGSDIDCLTAQISAAAKMRVKEDRGGPRFVPWEPPRRVEALASAKAKRVTRAARDHANEPSARPGAAVTAQFSPDRTAAERRRRCCRHRPDSQTVTHRGAKRGVTSNIEMDANG
jgi:hypothetical protein